MRRRPGESYTAAGLIARATLGAAALVGVVTVIAALLVPAERLSILAGGGIAVLINLVTLSASALAARYFADAQGAAMVGAYVVKMAAFGVTLLALRGSGLNLRVVVGVFALALLASLLVYSVLALRRAGPHVGQG